MITIMIVMRGQDTYKNMLRTNAHHDDADKRHTAISQHLDCAGDGLQRGALFKKCILALLR
jgi:hypothetical protein